MPPMAPQQSYKVTFDPPPWFAPSIGNAIGKRPYLYRGELPSKQSHAIISSRLKHPLYEQVPWFAALNKCLAQAAQQKQLILTTPQTTTHEFIQARQQKLAFTLGTIHCYSDPTKWAAIINKPPSKLCSPYDVLVGPTINAITTVNKKNLSSQPALRDQLLIASAKTIDVLHLRQNSLISTLLLNKPAQQVYYLKVKPQTTTPTKLNPKIPLGTSPLPAWFTQQNYLGHWTRDCDGPWPGETRQQWINQLLDGLPHANHSALNTLRRIIQSKTLTGTGNTIHGQQPMTCFTRVPITQWAGNHVYRPHLQRWDFGPHGLLIKREWLQTQGLLPVFYGTQQQCDTLSTNDRRYFQINEGSIDWRTEQEERVVGDLDLHGALSSDIIFFTQHQVDAEQLQSVCRWLVLSVGELCHDKLANSNIAEHQIRGTL